MSNKEGVLTLRLQKILNIFKSQKSLVCLNLAIHLFLLLFYANPQITGDGYGYYHIAKSISQGTFAPPNKPSYAENTRYVIEHNGKYISKYSPGSAFISAPFLFIVNSLTTDEKEYFKAIWGHTLTDGMVMLFVACMLSFFSLIFVFKSVYYYTKNSISSALISLCIYLSGYLVFYTFEAHSYSHIYEFFIVSILTYIMTIKHLEKKRILLLVGLITMLGIAIRPTLLIIFSIVIFYEMYVRNKVRLVNYIYIILGALPFLLAYILYNYQVFGKAMASGYYEIHSRTFDFSHSYLIEILFSDIRGWLVWSPIVILGIAGLSLEVKKKSNLVFLLIIFLYVVVYSFWDYWWGGFSIGQRFLIPLMPIIALGLGQLFAKQSIKLILFTLIIFTFIPFFITLTYKATPLPLLNTKNREDYPRIGNAELYTPIQIINYWYQTYLSAVPTYPSSFLGDSSPLSYFSSGQAFFIDIKKQGEDELMINTYWLNNEVSDSFTKVVIFAGESSQINKNLSISSNNEMFSILDKSQFTPELKKELINSYCPFVAFILKKYEEELIVLSNNYSMSIKDGERLEYDDCVHYTNL